MNSTYDKLCTHMIEEFSAFGSLNREDVEKLAEFSQCMNFQAGETLWEEGDSCDYVAFIVSGRVKVQKRTGAKGNQVVLGIYDKGSYVGALSILDGGPRAVTAQAMDDLSLVVITKENFDRLLVKYPAIGAALMKGMLLSLSRRLKNSFDRLVAIF